ncbi:unnamed protein product, partial [marine sediment metagenome]
LPQLSAGGIAAPVLKSEAPDFPFNILYGPIWAKHLPKFLKERPARKPDKMKLAKFTASHRLRAAITHTTFLIRKIFLMPSFVLFLILLGLALFNTIPISKLWLVGEIWLWIIITNVIIMVIFPITNFTRKFITKGLIYGIINVFILGSVSWLFHESLPFLLLSSCFYFWLAFFSTMSYSGYTMATSPSEIQDEYPSFSKINMIVLIISLVTLAVGIIFYLIF